MANTNFLQIVADLQVHSKYSRAVSKYMDLFEIASWASRKGVNLITTGDWQHPAWFAHLQEELQEVSPGVYQLKNPRDLKQGQVKFLLVSELSCVYTQGGNGRRIHHLVFSPNLSTCAKVAQTLRLRGANIDSDGRPIIALSSQDLLQLLLDISPELMLLPAHVWTPWYGLYGSKSGFDSLEECFGPLAQHIYAVETGLSSDPLMNWQIAELKNRSIVSFSDAHSGPKIGREATVFQTTKSDFTYAEVLTALKNQPSSMQLAYTVEFFPEEGKYFWTGHRACGVRYSPEEQAAKGDRCPVCGRPLTSGVAWRTRQLGDITLKPRLESDKNGAIFVHHPSQNRPPFVSLIPLLQILEQVEGKPSKAKRRYDELIQQATEFDLLLRFSRSELEKLAGPLLTEAIYAVRQRQIELNPGYDGVYGTMQVNLSNT